MLVPHEPRVVDEPDDVLDHDLAEDEREHRQHAQERDGDEDDRVEREADGIAHAGPEPDVRVEHGVVPERKFALQKFLLQRRENMGIDGGADKERDPAGERDPDAHGEDVLPGRFVCEDRCGRKRVYHQEKDHEQHLADENDGDRGMGHRLAVHFVDHVDDLRDERVEQDGGRGGENIDAEIEVHDPCRNDLGRGKVHNVKPGQGRKAVLRVAPDNPDRGVGHEGEAEQPADPDKHSREFVARSNGICGRASSVLTPPVPAIPSTPAPAAP